MQTSMLIWRRIRPHVLQMRMTLRVRKLEIRRVQRASKQSKTLRGGGEAWCGGFRAVLQVFGEARGVHLHWIGRSAGAVTLLREEFSGLLRGMAGSRRLPGGASERSWRPRKI